MEAKTRFCRSGQKTSVSKTAVIIGFAVVLGGLVRWPQLPEPCHSDIRHYTAWTRRMMTHGLGAAYGKGGIYEKLGKRRVRLGPCDNPVGQPAIFYPIGRWLYPALSGEPFSLELAVTITDPPDTAKKRLTRTLFELPAVLADLLTIALLAWWTCRRWGPWHGLLVAILYALHPAVIYNSVVWGQLDAWHSLGMTLCVMLMVEKKFRLAAVALAIALLFKFQAIVLVVLVGLCLLFGPAQRVGVWHWQRTGQALSAALTVVLIAWIPWLITGAGRNILDPYTRTVGQYHYLTVNAFNLYWLVQSHSGESVSDFTGGIDDRQLLFAFPGTEFGLSYRVAAILLFLAAHAVIACELLRRHCSPEAITWSAVMLCLCFFLFAPEMHERYLYPILPIVAMAYRPRLAWWTLALALGLAVTVNQACFFPASAASWLDAITSWARNDIGTSGNVIAIILLGIFALLWLRGSSSERKTIF